MSAMLDALAFVGSVRVLEGTRWRPTRKSFSDPDSNKSFVPKIFVGLFRLESKKVDGA